MKEAKRLIIFLSILIPIIYKIDYFTFKVIIECLYIVLIFSISWYYYEWNKTIEKKMRDLSAYLEKIITDPELSNIEHMSDNHFSKIKFQMNKVINLLNTFRKREVKEKERLQTLIADISHQLKIPLANTQMYFDLITPTPNQVEKFSIIKQQLHKLIWLSESLVKLSQVDSGNLNLKAINVNIDDVILKSIDLMHMKALSKGINIVYEPVNFEGIFDPKWTGEVINNILDNAIKYSYEETSILIKVFETSMFIKVEIENQGIGVHYKEMNRIFERFFRSQRAYDYEGSGIGLYLSQKIMTMQGGYIYAVSEGSCTTFTVNIRNH